MRVQRLSTYSQLGLEINWSKTKLQVFDDNTSPPSKVSVLGHDVEIVDSFVYLASCIDTAGGSEHDACRRIDRTCMKALDRNIWRSSISLQTKVRLYNVYIIYTTYSRFSYMPQTRGV